MFTALEETFGGVGVLRLDRRPATRGAQRRMGAIGQCRARRGSRTDADGARPVSGDGVHSREHQNCVTCPAMRTWTPRRTEAVFRTVADGYGRLRTGQASGLGREASSVPRLSEILHDGNFGAVDKDAASQL
jgi:hypothetical protein